MAALLGDFLEKVKEESLCLNYVKVVQRGEVVDECQRLYVKTRLNTWSMSKSFVGVAAGIAMEEGLISLDEEVCLSFPEAVPADASDNLRRLTVRHLLTMTSGQEDALFFCDNPQRYQVRDWVGHFFGASFPHKPGERFLYSNFCTYILGCLMEKKAGQNLLEYLRWRLFEPIGIGNPDWTLCPMGHVMAANGLYVTIDEVSRFGEFLLRGGVTAEGRRLVSADYLSQAMTKQVETAPFLPEDYPSKAGLEGYGYQFWLNPGAGENPAKGACCSGNYGQYCLVIPEKEAVISVLSLESRYPLIGDFIYSQIVPKLDW